MSEFTESPPIQVAWPPAKPSNDNDDARLADASLSHLMCALRCRLDGMSPERRSLNARLAAISLINIANRGAR